MEKKEVLIRKFESMNALGKKGFIDSTDYSIISDISLFCLESGNVELYTEIQQLVQERSNEQAIFELLDFSSRIEKIKESLNININSIDEELIRLLSIEKKQMLDSFFDKTFEAVIEEAFCSLNSKVCSIKTGKSPFGCFSVWSPAVVFYSRPKTDLPVCYLSDKYNEKMLSLGISDFGVYNIRLAQKKNVRKLENRDLFLDLYGESYGYEYNQEHRPIYTLVLDVDITKSKQIVKRRGNNI